MLVAGLARAKQKRPTTVESADLRDETQAAVLREVPEIAIACDQTDPVVKARLRDQCIGESRFQPSRVKARAQQSRAFPVPVQDVEAR